MKILTDKPSPQQVLLNSTRDSSASSSFLDCLNANMNGLGEEAQALSQPQENLGGELVEGLVADADESGTSAEKEEAATEEMEQAAKVAIDPYFLLQQWQSPVEWKPLPQDGLIGDALLSGTSEVERDIQVNSGEVSVAELAKKRISQSGLNTLSIDLPSVDQEEYRVELPKLPVSPRAEAVEDKPAQADLAKDDRMNTMTANSLDMKVSDMAQADDALPSKDLDQSTVLSFQERSASSMRDIPTNIEFVKSTAGASPTAALVSKPPVSSSPRAEAIQAKIDSIELVRDGLSGSGAHQVRIKLSPEEWGPVVTHVRVSNGRAEVEILTKNIHVTEAIKAQLPDLKMQFAQSNLELVSVDVREGSSNAFSQEGDSGKSAAQSYWEESQSALTVPSKEQEKKDRINKTLIDTYA